MVRSRAIWLKSTKILLPRSSFHQLIGDVVRHPPSELATQGDHRMPSLDEAVRWLDGNEHVDATTATGLRVTHQSGIVEDAAQLVRSP